MILFLESSLSKGSVDECYQSEYDAATELSIPTIFINFEDLTSSDESRVVKAFRKFKKFEQPQNCIYRGWMLTPTQYNLLYENLQKFNITLINNVEQYQNCHYLPDSYEIIKNHTAKSVWFSLNDLQNLEQIAKQFGNGAVIVKDYVKSEKHDWETACYVPDASDTENLKKIISNFVELRGNSFNVGIVLREFLNLSKVGTHKSCDLQLSEEYRLFFKNKKLVYVVNYWDCEYSNSIDNVNTEKFEKLAKSIDSNFFSMDIAKIENGEFVIMELGDGQVSGLPDNANLQKFFESIL